MVAQISWARAPDTAHSFLPAPMGKPHTIQSSLPMAAVAAGMGVLMTQSMPSRSRSRTTRRISTSGSSGAMRAEDYHHGQPLGCDETSTTGMIQAG